jgi:DNA repair protein RadC
MLLGVVTYTLRNNDLLLDGRKYVLRIRDLPETEKPREKLSTQGPEALKTAELLAIILSVGTVKEDVLSMAHRIIKEYGEHCVTSARDATALATELDIPLGKAQQIVAVMELGRRFFQKNGAGAAVIRTARDVYEYVATMRELPREHLRGLYLNAHYKVIHDEVISIGSIDANIVHPREVFKPALEYSAAAVILVHNHPSGVVTASKEDIEVTEQLIAAGKIFGIDLVDHVVVAKDCFESVPANYCL